MPPKTRLLAFCDDPAVPTGFGKVAQHVLYPLSQMGEYDIHICAINYNGDQRDQELYPYHYWAPYLGPKADFYGVQRARFLLDAVKPDVVWILNDMPIVRAFYGETRGDLEQYPVVTNSPVDGFPFPAHYLEGIRKATVPMVWTQYAKDMITGIDEELGERLIVSPLAYDPEEFYPMADTKADAKERAWQFLSARGIAGVDPTWYIVLRVDKNQQRKNWPATFEAFFLFADDKPDARLWCHTQFGVEGGFDLKALALMYGINKKVASSGLTPHRQGWPIDILNGLYNLADVHIGTPAGGGWELSAHEAKAAGCVTLMTSYGAMREVHGGQSLMIEPEAHYVECRNSTRYALANPVEAARLLDWVHDRPNDMARLRREGINWAREHTWEKEMIADRTDIALRRAMEEHDG